MAKRRLSQQQSRRISRQHDQRLNATGQEQAGLVVAHYGKKVMVRDSLTQQDHRCHFLANLPSLVAGDRVLWQPGKPFGVVVAIEPRTSILTRPDPFGKIKQVAANIDQIIIVNSVVPAPSHSLIDRYLVAAHAADIEPVILLNKIDLIDDHAREQLRQDLTTYRTLGYALHELSAKTNDGINQLRTLCLDKVSIIVGQSGVGKSSMVNVLLGTDTIKTGALSENSGQGTHTTTTAQLYELDSGGQIIDSPGIREFGLWHLSDDDIVGGFKELTPLLGLCKFRDCQHKKEPGCAILKAPDAGYITQERMASFHALRESILT